MTPPPRTYAYRSPALVIKAQFDRFRGLQRTWRFLFRLGIVSVLGLGLLLVVVTLVGELTRHQLFMQMDRQTVAWETQQRLEGRWANKLSLQTLTDELEEQQALQRPSVRVQWPPSAVPLPSKPLVRSANFVPVQASQGVYYGW